jgi:hypothetical protein
MSDISKFVHEVQRLKTRRGIYATAQSLRRMGLSLEGGIVASSPRACGRALGAVQALGVNAA